MLFAIGDLLAGASIGAVTALGVRTLVWPEMAMLIGMYGGMLFGMRDSTVANVQRAGFRIRREENVYLDIVKIVEAAKDG